MVKTRKITRTIQEEETIMDDSTAPRTSEDDSRISRRKSKRKKSKKVETPKSKKKGTDSENLSEFTCNFYFVFLALRIGST